MKVTETVPFLRQAYSFFAFFTTPRTFFFTQEMSWPFTPMNRPMFKVIKLNIYWNFDRSGAFLGFLGEKLSWSSDSVDGRPAFHLGLGLAFSIKAVASWVNLSKLRLSGLSQKDKFPDLVSHNLFYNGSNYLLQRTIKSSR